VLRRDHPLALALGLCDTHHREGTKTVRREGRGARERSLTKFVDCREAADEKAK
jgi:hypothetical protein